MRRFFLFLGLALIILIAGFYFFILKHEVRSAGFLNWMTPDDTYSLEADVSFGDHARDRIDYYTSTQSDESRPLLVFIHGGGWHRGDKSMYEFFAEGLTAQGYDVALPNYRLHPEIDYPDFLNDNARAIATIQKKFPSRYLVLIGHSAGGYNALMMGFKPEYLQNEGVEPCYTIRGIVSLAAPVGVVPMTDEPYITLFPERMQGDDSVLNNLSAAVPPLFLVNGEHDDSVSHLNAVKLGDALAARNIAQVKTYPGIDHIDPVSNFSTRGFLEGEIKADVIKFIENLPEDEGDGFCR